MVISLPADPPSAPQTTFLTMITGICPTKYRSICTNTRVLLALVFIFSFCECLSGSQIWTYVLGLKQAMLLALVGEWRNFLFDKSIFWVYVKNRMVSSIVTLVYD